MKRNPDTTFILQVFLSMSGVATNEWTFCAHVWSIYFLIQKTPNCWNPHLCPVGLKPPMLYMGM